jgi:hypothetical protein
MEPMTTKATVSTVAVLPKGYFLENFAVRSDNSLLITSLKTRELWYVPSAKPQGQVEPALLHPARDSRISGRKQNDG